MVKVVPTEGSPVDGEIAGKDHASPKNQNGNKDIDTANNVKNRDTLHVQKGNDAKIASSASPPAGRTADGASAREEGKHLRNGAATDADVSTADIDGDKKPQQQQALPAATKDPSYPAHADEPQQQALPAAIVDPSNPPDDSVQPASPVDPTASAGDPSKPPDDGDKSEQRGTPAVHVAEDSGGPEAATAKSQLPPPTLDMDKHSGMTTFSLMRQDEEGSSLDASDAGAAAARGQQENGQYNKGDGAVEVPEEEQEEFDGEEESEEPVGATFARRGTRRFVRQGTGIIMADDVSPEDNKKKKAPFHVPQTMYMGHPVGSTAAEFLERHKHRLVDVKNRREEVAGLLKLVVDHNPRNSGSDIPDIDKVFPDKRGRENSQGDWCI